LGICVSITRAQDKGKDTKYKRFSVPQFNNKLLDTLQGRTFLDSNLQKGNNPISIPNAYTRKENIMYAMPIKKLNGRGLATMPGTENLDKLEVRGQLDSLANRDKNKK
jgi:hypothetical protein